MTYAALFYAVVLSTVPAEPQTVLVVVGAPGSDAYGKLFLEWAHHWQQATEQAQAHFIKIGTDDAADRPDRDRLKNQLLARQRASADGRLWLVLIGHGTFDGRLAKFNLRGPDVSARELASWLERLPGPVAVINCSSASAPFINRLSGKRRVIITATKSGHEHNFARFGGFLSRAVAENQVDLDKDKQTSLLEAFLFAASQVAEFYDRESRLASEHALVDDNGDGLGTPASWFQGVRTTRSPKDGAGADGFQANRWQLVPSLQERALPSDLRVRRDELEHQILQLRVRKKELAEDEYFDQLQLLLIQLAELYESAEKSTNKEVSTS